MQNILSVMIVILIVIILLKAIGKRHTRKHISRSTPQMIPISKDEYPLYDLGCGGKKVACPDDLHASVMGLNEVELNTRSRGYVPHANQPNHVANLWKCDQSHCDQDESLYRNEYNTDITPMRTPAAHMTNDDVSNMHLTSRFGSVTSSK